MRFMTFMDISSKAKQSANYMEDFQKEVDKQKREGSLARLPSRSILKV